LIKIAHYAFINDDNIVVEVITGRDEDDFVNGITDWEAYYASKREGLRCLRTSYNTRAGEHTGGGTAFRLNYAGKGYYYDEQLDGFIPPKPYDSWILDESKGIWEAPVAYPADDTIYTWDEEAGNWVAVEES